MQAEENALRRIWRRLTKAAVKHEAPYFEAYLRGMLAESFQPTELEIYLTKKVDDVLAALATLDTRIGAVEAAVTANTTNITTAAGLFANNADASVELAADAVKLESAAVTIAGLETRLAATEATLAKDDAALVAAEAAAAAVVPAHAA